MIKARILLAEDDPAVSHLLIFKLHQAGFEVVHVTDGEEAARTLAAQARSGQGFDLALLDGRLPGRNGYAVLEEASAFAWVSGGVLISADDFSNVKFPVHWSAIRKPFDLSALVTRVQALAGQCGARGKDADPGFEQLLAEFTASFPARAVALERILSESEDQLRSQLLKDYGHRLAGAAGLYRLEELARVAGALEDALNREDEEMRARQLLQLLNGVR
jgi:DNA-binding response OmpR family regulator